MLRRGAHSGSRVDGRLLRLTTNEMESRERAGQVALGHVSVVVLFELSRAVCRVSGGFASGRAGRDPHSTTDHDAVHGLRAAPEPDAALCETFEVSQFVALVQ